MEDEKERIVTSTPLPKISILIMTRVLVGDDENNGEMLQWIYAREKINVWIYDYGFHQENQHVGCYQIKIKWNIKIQLEHREFCGIEKHFHKFPFRAQNQRL